MGKKQYLAPLEWFRNYPKTPNETNGSTFYTNGTEWRWHTRRRKQKNMYLCNMKAMSRHHQKHSFVLCMAVGTLMCCLVSAHEAIVFQSLDVTDGMCENYIRGMTSDVFGQMWFLTMNRVSRFDGYNFHTYNLDENPYWSDALHEIFYTADSLIWITGDKSNYIYHSREDYFDNKAGEQLHRYGMEGEIKQIFPDANGNLWAIRADMPYLYHYASRDCSLTSAPLSDGDKVWSICRCKDRITMLLTSADTTSHLYSLAIGESSLTIRRLSSVPYMLTEGATIYADSQGRIWLYYPHRKGLCYYDEGLCQWHDLTDTIDFADKIITCMADDGEGNLWIGTGNHGVCRLDSMGHLHMVHQGHTLSSSEGMSVGFPLADNHIASLHADTLRHTLWIGTSKQGVLFADLAQTPIQRIVMPEGEDISCLIDDGKGALWMGFDSQGIGQINTSSGQYTHQDIPLPTNQIVCTLIDSHGRHWWGSYGGSLFWLAPEGKGHRVNIIDDPRLQRIISLTEDSHGRIWAAGFDNGLFCLDAEGKHVISTYDVSNSPLGTNSLTKIIASTDGMLYVASSNGLFALDMETGHMDELLKGYARTIYLADNILWVGMENNDAGLIAINLDTGIQTILTTADGLSHSTICGITADKYGTLWVSTLDGITRVLPHPDNEKATVYTCVTYKGDNSTTGHISFNLDAITRTANDDVLMGGLGILVRITPDAAPPVSDAACVTRFMGLSLGGQRVEVGKPWDDGRVLLPQNILMGITSLTLRYNDTNIAFDLSAMRYHDRQSLRYHYRLSDHASWQTLDGNTLLLNHLSPGKYDLQVRTTSIDNRITGPVAHLMIVVTPPWWRSHLACLIYALCLVAAITAIILLSRHRHYRHLEQERHEMAVSQQREMAEAKMRFFTNVSHDMRTPLSLIITPLQRLLKGHLEPDMRTQLEIISHSAETLMDEVTQLLDFRKLDESLETATLVTGSLTDFIQQACRSFTQSELPGGVTLMLDLCPDPLIMRFDHRKMRRILFNLISNAIKYNRQDGTVTVHTHVQPQRNLEGERLAVLQVIDTGIGIRKENQERIFERFYQENHDEGTTYIGSGIGLHLVKQYVLMHKGTIKVDSEEPQGTIFTISLPLVEASTDDDMTTLACDSTADCQTTIDDDNTNIDKPLKSLSPARLLIVEDNDDFRLFLQSCLIDHYEVILASDGQQALRKLEQNEVNIIISDVMMPVMDGAELCRSVKNDLHYSHIPFIMLTARTTDEQQISGLQDGADDYIVKPFNLDILLLRIERLLRLTREAPERFRKMDVSPAEITISNIDRQLIEQAIAIVEHHMDEVDFSVEQFCDELGMSRSNVYKKLMAITGLSPLHFMRTLRIKRGRQLLEQGGYQVSQVAYQIGLSPKQFAKYFKEEYGISPSELNG